jgi:hypothetical protein
MSLLESGGWQPQRVSTGQALARAGMAGANAMQMQQKLELDREAAALKARETLAKTRNYESQVEDRRERRNQPVAVGGRLVTRDGDVVFEPPDSGKSAMGKIEQDFRAGLISQEERDAGIAKAMMSSGVRMTMNPDGTWTFEQGAGVTGGDPRTQSQLGRDHQDWIETQRNSMRRADELLRGMRSINQFPNVTGFRGAASENVSGVIGALSPKAGNAIARAGTGVDAETMGRLRTQLRMNVGPTISLVRDDKTGRYTVQDRERAEDIEASLDVMKSPAQAMGAYKQMVTMKFRGIAREAGQRGSELPPDMDVFSETGINAFGARLEEAGFSPEEVLDQIQELQQLARPR